MKQMTAISIDALTVDFSGFRALDQLTLIAQYGEIHGVIGPNGAGKTTMMDVITGITQPSSGRVFLDRDIDILRLTLPQRARAGIGRKFQRPSVFEYLTVRENIALGVRLYPDSLMRELAFGEIEEKHDRVEAVLKTISLDHLGEVMAGTLAHGQKQWLEIGMVLARDPKLLMLDEPVAGMSDAERDATADLLERLRSPKRCILLVEHDMQFVGRVSDQVSVLHEGRLLCGGSMDRVTTDPEVIRVYLGR